MSEPGHKQNFSVAVMVRYISLCGGISDDSVVEDAADTHHDDYFVFFHCFHPTSAARFCLKMMVVLRLLTLFFPYLVTTNAFVSRRARLSSTTHRQGASSGPTNETQQGFNPFDLTSHKISMPSTSRISIRKTQMQELMSNLLNVAGDDEATQVLLEASKDLLLEPLEDDHAVLETDSIYQPDMTRQERYQTYRTTMLERIDKARNSNARWVLEKMSDYVLSHE